MHPFWKRSISLILLCTLVLSALLATPQPAQAAVIVVNTQLDQSGDDPSKCALREAIMSVNTASAVGGCPKASGIGDLIILPGGTYTLNKAGKEENAALGDLDLLKSVTITGEGPGVTIISADASLQDRVFHNRSNATVNISNLTITGGNANSYPHESRLGGGIYNERNSQLYLYKVEFAKNYATALNGSGGGLANKGMVYINAVTFRENEAFTGGAIYNNGQMYVAATLFQANKANNQVGGGIDHRPWDIPTDILTVINSTFSGNTSPNGAAVATAGKATLKSLTIADNGGGPTVHLSGSADLFIQNTILARNTTAHSHCSFADVTPRVTSLGYNLADGPNNLCRLNNGTDKTSINMAAVLPASLAANEGPTLTYALLTSGPNPAISAIPMASCPGSDQRLLGRAKTDWCDVGAYEDDAIPLSDTVFLPLIIR